MITQRVGLKFQALHKSDMEFVSQLMYERENPTRVLTLHSLTTATQLTVDVSPISEGIF